MGKTRHRAQKNHEKKILLLGEDDLLSKSVERMLSEKAGWEVVFLSSEQLQADIFSLLENLSPDVVVNQRGHNPRTSKALSILFHSNPKLKLITITLESNVMEVYNKENIVMQSAADLISAIEA